MSYLLIIVLVFLYSFQSIFGNKFPMRYKGDPRYVSPVYSTVYGVFVALFTLLLAGIMMIFTRQTIQISMATMLFGLLNGFVLWFYNFSFLKSCSTGPFSILMIFNLSGGIIVPLLWSCFYDGDILSLWQYVACGIILISFVLLNTEKGATSKLSFRYILWCLALFMANGSYGTVLSAQKKAVGAGESVGMVMLTFGFSAVFSLINLFFLIKPGEHPHLIPDRSSLRTAIAASACAASAVNLLMYCMSLINVVVLYSLDNCGVLIISVLWSVLFLHEKITRNKFIGLILACIAVVMLSTL